MKKLSSKRIFMASIILLVVSFSLYAISPTYIIPMDSSLYDDIEALYLVTGYGTPSNKRPWSAAEATLILSRIDKSLLTDGMQEFFTTVTREVEKNLRYTYDKNVDLGFFLDLNAEMYTHSNGSDFSNEADWDFGFPDRSPMLRLRFDMAFSDFLYIYSDLQYQRNRFRYGDSFGEFFIAPDEGIMLTAGPGKYVTSSSIYNRIFLTNWMSTTYDLDFQVPKRALISTGGKHWNLSIARDKIRWGNGHSGNFVISDHDDYQEYVRFVLFSDKFSYDWTNMFFETNINSGEANSADQEFKIFMAHRLEFRPIDRITFAISENVMYQNDVFSFRHINPANVYHNLNINSMFNAIAHVELDVMLAPGFNLYGQFALDQARAPNESAAQVEAFGYLFGLEHAVNISKGILFSSLEFATTSPAMYRRSNVDFITFRRYHGNNTSFVTHFDYLGYEYGGDAQVLQLDISYRLPKHRKVALQLMYMRQGEVDFFTDNSVVNATTDSSPSGAEVAETFKASISAEYSIDNVVSFADTRIWAHLTYIGRRDYTKATRTYHSKRSDVQFTLGISLIL